MPVSRAPDPPPALTEKTSAPALDRGLRVLRLLSRRGSRGAGAAEIMAALRIPPASAYRILLTLESRRFVAKDSRDGRFRLGPEVLSLAGSMLAGLDLRAVAHPHLRSLFEKTKETVELSVLQGDHLVVIDKVEGEESVHTLNVGGHRAPFLESAGLVLLAGVSEERARGIIERHALSESPPPVFRSRKLFAALAKIRETGCMADEDPAFERPNRRARRIAVAIRDHLGQIQAALGMAVAISRWKPDHIARLRIQILEAAQEISALMGRGSRDPDDAAGKPSISSGAGVKA